MSKTFWWVLGALVIGAILGWYTVGLFPPAAKPGTDQTPTNVPSPGQPGAYPDNGYMMGPGMMGQWSMWPGYPAQKKNRKFGSNGESIYYTAVNKQGERIGAEMMNMQMNDTNFSCVDCHGENGRGRKVEMMMGSFTAPDIRYSVLKEGHSGNENEDHEPYNDQTLARAIIKGIDPGGIPLNYPMPRWQMKSKDVKDLISYLKELD